jgi:hypothetical protein
MFTTTTILALTFAAGAFAFGTRAGRKLTAWAMTLGVFALAIFGAFALLSR